MARDQAQLDNAKVDLGRYQTLLSQDSIARQNVDAQASTVAQLEAALKVDQAAIDSARLNLTYSRITAPISGRVGLRLVDAGNVVSASSTTGLVVITQVEPIAVVFTLPEDALRTVLPRIRAGARLPVDAFDRSGAKRLARGSVVTIDNQIDPSTGTVRIKAVFDNRDHALFPAQFVNVQLLADTRRAQLVVPAAAVQQGPQGSFVYLVPRRESCRAAGRGRGSWTVNAPRSRGTERRRLSSPKESIGCARAAHVGGPAVSPSGPFILRPVATSLLMVGVVIAGTVAYQQLPVSALPEVDYPTIQVTTFYPGASPDVMATAVTAPLERQFGQMPGLKQMTSTSSFGARSSRCSSTSCSTSTSPSRRSRRR